jgi:alkylation response protein AidB-like acyl-CoA dehydrogenase
LTVASQLSSLFGRTRQLEDEAGLRRSVRSFLARQTYTPSCDSWLSGFDADFSRRLGEAGFVGMAIPKEYGGHGRSALERFVVVEELLAAGAPVGAHWMADRQTAPLLLRFGTEEQRRHFLPRIVSGKCFFSIGMSEPSSGSDLASITTYARKVEGGYRINGQKVWTTNAHRAHYMVTLCRTSPAGNDRRLGLSQLIVPLDAGGVDVRPILLLSGEAHFTEVFLTDVLVSDDRLIGVEGDGWLQVMSELAFERSGPERVLSTFPLLAEFVRQSEPMAGSLSAAAIGRRVAHLAALRRLSRSVAATLDGGIEPLYEAALVKDLGTRQEQEVVEAARRGLGIEPDMSGTVTQRLLADAVLAAPGFTLRGGTNEILRGIVARGLGLR